MGGGMSEQSGGGYTLLFILFCKNIRCSPDQICRFVCNPIVVACTVLCYLLKINGKLKVKYTFPFFFSLFQNKGSCFDYYC